MDRAPLVAELKVAFGRPLNKVFREPGDKDKFPLLARICEAVEPEKWDRSGEPYARYVVTRAAVEALPDEFPKGCAVTWRQIGMTLGGFREDLPPKYGHGSYGYKDLYKILKDESDIPEIDHDYKLRKVVVDTFYEMLADTLVKLEKQEIKVDSGASKDKESQPVNGEKGSSEKPSEPDSPSVHQSNYGLFNLVSHGPTSIFAGGITVAFVVVVALLATNLGSRSPDGSNESNSSSGPVETEASNSVSDSSAAPAVRGEQVLATTSCFGGTMIPNKTIQDVNAVDAEIEELGILDGTPEGTNRAEEMWGAVESVIGVAFTVHASREAPVTIDRIIPDIEKSPAPEGVILRDVCGDPMPSHFTRLDLDSETFDTELPTNVNHPLGTSALEDISAALNYYELVDLGLPFEITEGNPGSFLVVPTTEECWCEWTLTVEWSSHEDEGEITFDNEGEPFVTISPSKMDAYIFSDAEPGTSWVQEDL